MNDLSPLRLTFDALFARAVAEWPDEVRLPRRELAGGGYMIEGLIDLEQRLDDRAKGAADDFLTINLNWAIGAAVHEALAHAAFVRPADLARKVRAKFHGDLRSADAGGWTAADLMLRDRYLAANAEAA